MKFLKILIYSLFILSTVSSAQENEFITLSSMSTRYMGMGGAFLSVEDNLASLFYNPGSFTLYDEDIQDRVTVFINPLLPLTAFAKPDKMGLGKYNSRDKFFNTLKYFLKGLVYSVSYFDFGLSLWEESILKKNNKHFFPDNDIENYTYSTFFAKAKLAARISLGLAISRYNQTIQGIERKGYLINYGVLMKPEKYLRIGISYFDLPLAMENYNDKFYNIKDETVNIGISFYPSKEWIISIDANNLNTRNSQEARLGVEKRFSKYFALRGGFYRTETFRKSENRKYYWTCGVGLLSSNYFKPRAIRFLNEDFIINYSYVFEKAEHYTTNWHFFNCIFSF